MAVKPGYKKTEVGLIPVDWDLKSLGRLIDSVEYGSSTKSVINGNIPVLRMGNLQSGKVDWNDLVYTNDESEIKKYKLCSGDVLFNRTNTIDLVGKTSIYKGERPAIFAGYLIRIKVDRSQLDSRFLNYILNTEISKRHSAKVLSVAVGQANINSQKLKTYPIPLPPTLAEQESIAEALSDADALIESLEQLLTKKRRIKQGAMQELLTGKKRLPGFQVKPGYKQTEVGVIPVDWDIRTLRDLAPIATGNTPPTRDLSNYGDEFLFVSPVDIGSFKYISRTEKMLSKKGFSISRLFPAGTVLFVCIGSTIGKCGVAPVALTSNQQINAIFPSDKAISEYLYYSLVFAAPRIKSLAGEQAVPIVNKNQFSETMLPLPLAFAEQEAIATILSDMDMEIAAIETKLSKARQIKQGMMQELLTGRTRLI